MKKLNRFLNKITGVEKRLGKLTLPTLESKMDENGFDPQIKEFILQLFQKQIKESGEKEFQLWLYNLSFSVPEELSDEDVASRLYTKHQSWFEQEIQKLEKETGLPFEVQTEDIAHVKLEARKAQLVIRDRIYMIVLEILG
ncbi:hypothetical protein [Caldalkalibacillus mannanilyticus]|uniref:hypothetical protein n=1 Tax=Caldalkalibacillus mannanilyticus TaxID=1418 RepID=UPI000468FD44|nr:hypothetical protein [Caldalkalibacillus mannanilyticus]